MTAIPPSGSRASAAEAANRAAVFLPVSGPGTVPAMQVAGTLAFLYVDGYGVVQFALDLDDAERWLVRPDSTVAVCVSVQGGVVYQAGPKCQDPANADCTHDHEGCSIYAEQPTGPGSQLKTAGDGHENGLAAGGARDRDDAAARLLAWLTAPDSQIG